MFFFIFVFVCPSFTFKTSLAPLCLGAERDVIRLVGSLSKLNHMIASCEKWQKDIITPYVVYSVYGLLYFIYFIYSLLALQPIAPWMIKFA